MLDATTVWRIGVFIKINGAPCIPHPSWPCFFYVTNNHEDLHEASRVIGLHVRLHSFNERELLKKEVRIWHYKMPSKISLPRNSALDNLELLTEKYFGVRKLTEKPKFIQKL